MVMRDQTLLGGRPMVERIELISNVGQFDTIAPGAQLPFTLFTLIYAENGRGKTTLSAVLRSLATSDRDLINARHRLGAANPPEVRITARGNAAHVFQNNAWSAPLPNIGIFDDVFVTANVCSGIEIETTHRQNLHELILGAQGVALNAALQNLVAAIEEHNRQLRQLGDAIPANVRGVLSVDDFCNLPPDPNLAENILEADRRLAAAQSAAAINAEPLFITIDIPEFGLDETRRLLRQSIEDLDAAAAAQVQAHVERLGAGSESWIAAGVGYIPAASQAHGQTCPFCFQSLDGSEIVQQYRSYFGEAYDTLKRAISDAIQALARTHGGDIPAAFERAIRMAEQRRAFWARFADVPALPFDPTGVGLAWAEARNAVDAALREKQAHPLEAIELSEAGENAVRRYHQLRAEVVAYSNELIATNAQIDIVKEQADAANIAALRADRERLAAVEARHSAAILPLCDAYLREKAAKAATEIQRDNARVALDNYRQNIFPHYEVAINQYLQRFGAGFRLQGMASVNNRGGSSVTYSMLINQNAVPLSAYGAPGPRDACRTIDQRVCRAGNRSSSKVHLRKRA
jgi:wobble nucleotide-excising tRNase